MGILTVRLTNLNLVNNTMNSVTVDLSVGAQRVRSMGAGEPIHLNISNPMYETLTVAINNGAQGYVVVPLNQLLQGQPQVQTLPLSNGGSVTLELTALDFGQSQQHQVVTHTETQYIQPQQPFYTQQQQQPVVHTQQQPVYAQPVYTQQVLPPPPTQTVIIEKQTPVVQKSSSGVGAFVGGAILGSALSSPRRGPVVVAPRPVWGRRR
jgi:hypothetical protein